MGLHVTEYETKNGKTFKAGGKAAEPAAKPAAKNGAQGLPGADNKNRPDNPAKQGA